MGPIRGMNFAGFDLNLLRVFDALMRERSVTRAGDRVGLSQPAVSAALNRLRAALEDQLFVRRGAEMVPTPKAEALAPPIRAALVQVEAALFGDARFDPAASERTFSLMGADFFSTLVMPRLFTRVRAIAPRVRLRLVDSARGEVDRLLQEDVVDLALERPLSMPEWVASERLFLSPFVVIARADDPAVAATGARPGEPFPLEGFCALPHAIRSIDGSLSGLMDQALAEAGRAREVVLGLPHFHAVALAVAQGGLLAAVPRQFADAVAADLGLELFGPPVPTPVPEIKMYWRKRHDRNPALAWLRAQVHAVVAAL